MSVQRFEVTSPTKQVRVEFELDIGDTLDEMVERYGEMVVYKLAFEKAKTSAMNLARNLLSSGKTPEEVVNALENEWTPVRRMKTAYNITLEAISEKELEEI